MTKHEPKFTFAISLSVLNHLGRQLYRSFATVLGEAISNAWDADATTVWINLDPDKNGFWVKDDGSGMTGDDFQNKFLKIGYSKRKSGDVRSPRGRPYIGRKGIGKLALLSCADRVSVLSKVKGGAYVGGTIDNSSLDEAITDDLMPQQYKLSGVDPARFASQTKGHDHGTILRFDGLKDRTKRSFEFLRQTVALYFRFSLLDEEFSIYFDGVKITHEDLRKLIDATEFLWKIGAYADPFVAELESAFQTSQADHEVKRVSLKGATGFLASVRRPRDLAILTTDERVGVDLFVNGRLRERNVLRHIPTAQIPESYLYGQIHCAELDDGTDRFTSSREAVVADDPKFVDLLEATRKLVLAVVDEWDALRLEHRREGDVENPRTSKAERASQGLYNAVSQEFTPDEEAKAPRRQVEEWTDDLSGDAAYNFESYAECFVSENLIRRYIEDSALPLTPEAQAEASERKRRELEAKNKGNVSIEIRRVPSELSYLSMDYLANLADKAPDRARDPGLSRDALEFKPMRDAVAHTALLTDTAKQRLKAVRENIKARIRTLLSGQGSGPAKKGKNP